LAAGLALVALGATASLARADDSQIRISEVYSDGTTAHNDFIELQLLADGQTPPPGASIRICNAIHSVCEYDDFPADSALAAANSQRTFIFAWADGPYPNPDFTLPASTAPPNLNFPIGGGDACYLHSFSPDIPLDCVAWGNSTLQAPSVGSAAPAMNGGQSLTRTESRGCPTLMEAIDDSDNSAADFSLATISPRNNLQTPSETPCTTPAPASAPKKKCKKKKHKSSAVVAKKKCKKKKR
jgi:hypothetical protein